VIAHPETLNLHVRGQSMEAGLTTEVGGPAGEQVFATFELGSPEQRIGLSADRPVEVVLVAYED